MAYRQLSHRCSAVLTCSQLPVTLYQLFCWVACVKSIPLGTLCSGVCGPIFSFQISDLLSAVVRVLIVHKLPTLWQEKSLPIFFKEKNIKLREELIAYAQCSTVLSVILRLKCLSHFALRSPVMHSLCVWTYRVSYDNRVKLCSLCLKLGFL